MGRVLPDLTAAPALAATPPAPHRIGFLLLPRFSMMAFVSAVEPLRVANRFGGGALYGWQIISPAGEPVAASNGMMLVADAALDMAARYPMVIVCAGFDPEAHFDRRLRAWLRRLDRQGTVLGAIDTGSFVLARAGLLDGYRATTHWESLDSFREQFPKVEVDTGLFAINRNRCTCAGGTAALDMMLHLIGLQHGHRLATAVSEQFIHDRIRDARDRQRMEPRARYGIFHSGLARVIALMEQHLEDPLASVDLSRAAGISLRQLERLFRRYLKCTPRGRGPSCNIRICRSPRWRSPAASARRRISRAATPSGRGGRRVPSARPKHPGRRPAFAERGARQGLFPGSGHSILYPISSGSNSWR